MKSEEGLTIAALAQGQCDALAKFRQKLALKEKEMIESTEKNFSLNSFVLWVRENTSEFQVLAMMNKRLDALISGKFYTIQTMNRLHCSKDAS